MRAESLVSSEDYRISSIDSCKMKRLTGFINLRVFFKHKAFYKQNDTKIELYSILVFLNSLVMLMPIN